MGNSLVSIIIPVYNSSKYLHRCLDSVLNQTYKDFECICINDGSTDNSLEILNEYKNKDERILVFSHKNNGVGYTRNIGINHAKGEYITFIDSDDFIGEKFLEYFIKQIDLKKYDLLIGGYVKYNGNEEKIIYVKDDKIGKYLHTGPRGRIFNREFITSNKILFPDRPPGEDAYFNLLAYNLTKNIGVIKSAEYYYDISNDTSIMHTSKTFDNKFLDWLDLVYCIKPIDHINKDLIEYYLIKSSVIYLLFCGRNDYASNFMTYYDKIFGWLKKNIPNYKKNKYISLFSKSDSNFIYKLAVRGFILMDRLKLIPLLSKIWCK